jgi:hypothetical protein
VTGCDPGGCRFESYYLPCIGDSFQNINKLNILTRTYSTKVKTNALILVFLIKILHTLPLTKSLINVLYSYKFIPISLQKLPKTTKLNVTFPNKNTKINQLNNFLKKTFNTFLYLTLPTSNFPFKTHYSFNNLYTLNTIKGSPNIFSIVKFLKNYYSIWGFVYNIFFYNIKTLFFGPPFLKKELCSLNSSNVNPLNFKLKFNGFTLLEFNEHSSFFKKGGPKKRVFML